MDLKARLKEMGIAWEDVPVQNPVHPLVTAKLAGNLVFVSGQVPMVDGGLVSPGKVGGNVSVEAASDAARICALNCIYAAGAVVDPDRIAGVVKLLVFVNGAISFNDTSKVANGASNFLIEVFGEDGMHARSAVGVLELPLGACVEIEAIFVVR